MDTVKSDTEYFAKKQENHPGRMQLEGQKVKKQEAEDYYNDVKQVEKKTKVRRQVKKKVK